MKSFQFSLRDVFLLLLVTATGIGWMVDHHGAQTERLRVQARNDQLADESLLHQWQLETIAKYHEDKFGERITFDENSIRVYLKPSGEEVGKSLVFSRPIE